MGFRDRYEKIKTTFDAARERYRRGSLREALGVLLEDPDKSGQASLAPPPAHGKCDNHPHKRKQTFGGMLTDLLVVPAIFAGWWKELVLEPDYLFPGADPCPVLQPPKAYGLDKFEEKPITFWKTDKKTGEKTPTRQLAAWYAPAKPGFPTLAYCHGNAGSLDARRVVLQELNNAGFGVMIAAYPGFKGSKEDISGKKQAVTERGFVGAAKAMYAVLRRELEARKEENPNTNIVMFGESLGGAVAMQATRDLERGDRYHGVPKQDVAAVVCFAAFRSLPERVREEYPLLPASHLMGIHLDAESVVAKIKAPVTLLHGTADDVTCHHHSLSLQKAGGSNVDVLLIPGANHRLTKPKQPGSQPLMREMVRIDREQVRKLIGYVQSSLHKKGLCPAPELDPTYDPGTVPAGKKNWGNTVSGQRRRASEPEATVG